MARIASFLLLVAAVALTGCAAPKAGDEISPLPRAHAHNDYEHSAPLQDALRHGFCSVEADIFLVDGELLVAHDRKDCRPGRTIDSLYLAPLAQRARDGRGHVYPGVKQSIILLVDIKADGEAAYAVLHEKLAAAADVFTEFDKGVVFPRAVTVVISGNIPRETMSKQARRFAFVDGRMPDLSAPIDQSPPTALVPLVSLPWYRHFIWDGKTALPEAQMERLKTLVEAAHARGYWIRFWAVPETELCWRTLHEAGVDLINADDLGRAAAALRGLDATPRTFP